MKRIYVIALIGLCFNFGISHAQNIIFRGIVVDITNHKPIEFANVYLENTSNIVYSNHDGSYIFKGVKPGNYVLCASCIGYHTYKTQVNLDSNNKIYNIELKPSVENLSPIVVTGTGTKYRLENAPVQTEIISGETIRQVSGRGTEEIISNLSASLDFNTSSMGSTIKINGLGDDCILILVNGKRLTGNIGNRFDLSRIDPNDIKQIEIVKGASSTLYGSDAIAGVINIITKKPKQNISIKNSTRVGAHNEWKQLNTLSYKKDKLSTKTSFSRSQTDGWQLNTMEYNRKWESNHELPYLKRTYDKPVNKKRSYTLTQSLSYNFNPKLNMDAELSWYEKTLFFPFKGNMHNYYYNNRSASTGGKYRLKNKNYINFSLEYGNFLYYKTFPYKYNEQYITPDGVLQVTYYPGDRFKNSEQTNITFNAKGVFYLNNKNTLSIGTEILGDYLEAKYRLVKDNVNAYTYALYLQDEFKLKGHLSFVGGIRFIYHEKFGTIATPKISAMYKTGKFTHRATYANGFRSPTLKELYYYYESNRMGTYTLYKGNSDLKPQKSNYYSISTQFRKKAFKTDICLFINQIKNMIDYKILPTEYDHERRGVEETKMRYNINEAQLTGADWSFTIKPISDLSVNGSYSYVDAQNQTLSTRLNGTSEHSATFKTSWTQKWNHYSLNLNISGTYRSDKFYLEEDDYKQYADKYQLWKLTTSHTFKKYKNVDIILTAGIDNIFNYVDNRPYGGHYGTLNPGRTLFTALNIIFNKDENRQ